MSFEKNVWKKSDGAMEDRENNNKNKGLMS